MAEWIADALQDLLAQVRASWCALRRRYTGPDECTVHQPGVRADRSTALDDAAAFHCRARPPRAIAVDGKVLRGSGATG